MSTIAKYLMKICKILFQKILKRPKRYYPNLNNVLVRFTGGHKSETLKEISLGYRVIASRRLKNGARNKHIFSLQILNEAWCVSRVCGI